VRILCVLCFMLFPFPLLWLTLKPRTAAAADLRWNLAARAALCQLAIVDGVQSNESLLGAVRWIRLAAR